MKFRTIVADPPWKFPNRTLWQRQSSVPSNQYETLTLAQIAQLGEVVRELRESRSSALWLWSPTHHLIRGLTFMIAEAWGFRPMTTMIWCKPQIGLGHYIRNSHEPVLLGVSGRYKLKERDQSSWFVSDRTQHSKKPNDFRDIVERVCHPPYLELFAREEREGWICWGNEVGDPLGIGFDPDKWGR